MTNRLTNDHTPPSLAALFESEREPLSELIRSEDASADRAVGLAREAIERTAQKFRAGDGNVQAQKTGLWLLEMVKSGAGVLERAAEAELIWTEVPKRGVRVIAGSSLFYGTAFIFFIMGWAQSSRSTMVCAFVLAAMRFFNPKDWSTLWRKIPFILPLILKMIGKKLPPRLEAPTGESFEASTIIRVDGRGYVDAISDSLRTADHVLARLSVPAAETHWYEEPRLLGFMQTLLEAAGANDGEFALKLVDHELQSVLAGHGIEIIHYSNKTKASFDVLPMLDLDDEGGASGPREASPALAIEGKILRRGTVWMPENSG